MRLIKQRKHVVFSSTVLSSSANLIKGMSVEKEGWSGHLRSLLFVFSLSILRRVQNQYCAVRGHARSFAYGIAIVLEFGAIIRHPGSGS